MPYDFYKMKSYSIDYSSLLNTFLSFPTFMQSADLQKQYITKWLSVLSDYDKSIVEIMTNPNEVKKYILLKQTEPEVFQIPIYFEKNTLLLHFRITPLLQMLDYHKQAIETTEIDTNEFITDDKIKWTKESKPGKAPIDMPIILAPFPIGHYSSVVVDGNHRISQIIKTQRKCVSSITLAAKTFIDAELFACGFDKLLYTMLIEFQCAKACHDKGMSDNEIIQLSYLNTNDGTFHHVE